MEKMNILFVAIGIIIVLLGIFLKFKWNRHGWKKQTIADFVVTGGIALIILGYMLQNLTLS